MTMESSTPDWSDPNNIGAPPLDWSWAFAANATDPFMGHDVVVDHPPATIDLPNYEVAPPTFGGLADLDNALWPYLWPIDERAATAPQLPAWPETFWHTAPEGFDPNDLGMQSVGGGMAEADGAPTVTMAWPADGSDLGAWLAEDFFDWAAATLPTPPMTPPPDEVEPPTEEDEQPNVANLSAESFDGLRLLAETALNELYTLDMAVNAETTAWQPLRDDEIA